MKIEQLKEVASQAVQALSVSLEQGQSEVLRKYLAAVGKFHRYSASNILLIVAQRPAETGVPGAAKIAPPCHKRGKGHHDLSSPCLADRQNE
jgi:hypothetical protein